MDFVDEILYNIIDELLEELIFQDFYDEIIYK
jgi:hypothetical protein